MEKLFYVMLIYALVINLAAFVFYGADKHKAIHGSFRIPEATLIMLAFFGGSLGAWLGMKVFHHKTKKPKFLLVPFFLVLHIIIVLYCIYRLYVQN